MITMLALARGPSRLQLQLQLQPQPQLHHQQQQRAARILPACASWLGPSYPSRGCHSGGNLRNLCPVTTALLAAGSPRFCPAAPVRSLPAHHILFPARPISTSSISSTALSCAASSLRTRARPRPPLDSSDIGKPSFSTSRAVMSATKIDGTAIAKRIREGLHAEILEKKKINPRFIPSLKIIQGEHSSAHWPATLNLFRN